MSNMVEETEKDIIQAPPAHQEHQGFDHADENLKDQPPVQLMSHLDTLSVWQAVKVYKRVTLVAMLAAFSASLDGYRESKRGTTGAIVFS
jgi:hypothetical protein